MCALDASGAVFPPEDPQLMADLFEAAPEAILIAGDDRRYIAANPAACRLLGRSREEILSMRVEELLLPDRRPGLEAAWGQLLEKGVVEGQREFRRPDGSVRFADYRTRANIQPGRHASFMWDVTDRVLAERALEARADSVQNARYRLIAEHASDVLFLATVDGIVEWVSPSVEAAMGWRQEDVIGAPTSRFHAPDDTDALVAFTQGLQAGLPFRCEMRVLTRDQTQRWMEFTVTPVRDEAEHVIGWLSAVRDCQARHEAEDELRANRDLLAAIVGTADESIYAKDTEGVYLLQNAASLRALGKTAEEVLGRDDQAIFPPDEAASLMAVDREVLESRATKTFDEYITLADGRRHWLLSTKGPLHAADGTLIGLFGVSRDITDRVAAEQALRDSERRFRELYEGIDSILVYRLGDDQNSALNPAVEQILGYPVELVRRDVAFWNSLVHPDDISRARETWDSDATSWVMEYRMRRADGAWIWVRDRGNRTFRPDGRPARTFGVISDVTELHVAAEQLARASRLESLGRLASGLAHDFNNVLVGIGLIADWIARHPADPAVEGEAKSIMDASERGKQLIRSLLGFARGGTAERQRTDVGALVQDTVDLASRLVGPSVVLSADTAVGLPEIDVDRSGLVQVLLNLVVNARDAMPDGGEIRIDVRRAELRGSAATTAGVLAGRYIRTSVTDTGTGIAPEMVERVFEPWFTTKEGDGSGLGLATAYRFARANGGGITVETELGRGTTFHVYLPIPPGVPGG